MSSKSYQELATTILHSFINLPRSTLDEMVHTAYTREKFGSDDITPVREIGSNMHLLGLSNGPTLAFKDIGMQLLAELFKYQLDKTDGHLNVLGATSGDTGSAAEVALQGNPRIKVFMLSPEKNMSPFQRAQMYSLQDPNIANLCVRGSFDDSQDVIKGVDAQFKQENSIGTVNSINWARIAAQTVYYFKGYFAVAKDSGKPVDFVIPSGNMGDFAAAYLAKRMGLPIRNLIIATNQNNVLEEFYRTGIYRPREKEIKTSSPSMDITKASNFERFVYWITGNNAQQTAAFYAQLKQEGQFSFNATPYIDAIKRNRIFAGMATENQQREAIRRVHSGSGYIIDPHTADGVWVGMNMPSDNVPMIFLETALATKFEEYTQEVLGKIPPRPARFVGIETLPQRYQMVNPSVSEVMEIVRTQGLR
jgi:threonine synthase